MLEGHSQPVRPGRLRLPGGSALLIGYGSIGARHARLLAEFGYAVHAVTGNAECPWQSYSTIPAALVTNDYAIAVIANPATRHVDTILELRREGYGGRILLEKPVANLHPTLIPPGEEVIRVGYNLRFHPLLRRVRKLLNGRRIFTLNAYVGQYLPDWRPEKDYRHSVTARAALGGGVLRELSHELDMVLWLTGAWKRVSAQGGRAGNLDMDTDDHQSILLQTQDCQTATIHMNCLDRIGARTLQINAEGMSLHADFSTGMLLVNGDEGELKEQFRIDKDETYKAQLVDVLTDMRETCTWQEGLAVMGLVEAIELAEQGNRWITS